jgi:DNA invertase Pin-like site-specific DNA recombinase
MCEEWQNNKRTATSIMEDFKITGNTFYRWINKYNEKNPEKKMVLREQSPKLKIANKKPNIDIDVDKFKLMANEWASYSIPSKFIMKEFGITKYIFYKLLKKYDIKQIKYQDVDIEKFKNMCLEWANKKRTSGSIVNELNISWTIFEKLKRIHGIRKNTYKGDNLNEIISSQVQTTNI